VKGAEGATPEQAFGRPRHVTSLGPIPVNVTYYGMKSLPMTYCGITITSFVEGAGTVPGTNLPLILYTSFQDSYQGASTTLTTKIVSLTVASP